MTTVEDLDLDLDLDLAESTVREQVPSPRRSNRREQRSADSGLWTRRRWLFALGIFATWSLWDSLVGRGTVLNSGGWTQVERFLSAAANPELDHRFLNIVARSAGTTVGYAVVGTALSLVIGLIGGMFMSDVWWSRDPLDMTTRSGHSGGTRRPLILIRVLAVVPRGIHEAVWALIFVYILGRNPLVAVLAIGIPFGAITAKVVADTIDTTGREPVATLRAAGAGRFASVAYGIAPTVIADITSHGFYRFECALRSSVVLGAIGAGGLGFQLSLSFQSLRYDEIWTLIWALVILSAIADWWGSSLRHRMTRRRLRLSMVAATSLTVISALMLRLNLGTLYDDRARRLAGDLTREAWPPRLPAGGWPKLLHATIDTLQLSVIALTFAAIIATPLAFIAARPDSGALVIRLASRIVRAGLLLMRSIPPTVWALIILFVVFPGPLPGGLALGFYTIGVLGRLNAEIVENADRRPYCALRAGGAPAAVAFAYGSLPVVASRFSSLAMYRWEVAARETVIVGFVGAGGLGRLLAQQNAAFDEAAMLTTVVALIAVSTLIDIVSKRVRLTLS